jgi:hypothetical protein
MTYYETLSAATTGLVARGYNLDFNLNNDHLHCEAQSIQLFPEDFHIDEVHRFEGDTDPSDEAVVYAVSSEKYGIKGVLVDGYGISSGAASSEILAKLVRF